jgi:Anti-repressor SinI
VIEQGEQNQEFDSEWIQLILEAKNLGIAKEEIQTFLRGQKMTKVIMD